MGLNTEKAQVMFKLARKGNWNNSYDRTEHFKRFEFLDKIIKELSKLGWIMVHKKGKFIGLSLNTQYKKEIIAFIEINMPELMGAIK